jgi:hypothetical protein
MSLNLQSNGTGTGRKLGWLVWWTIEGKDLDTSLVVQAAKDAGIPGWLISRISGRGEKAAWMVSTQTGVKGIERPRSSTDPLDATIRYMTKDVNPECRAIVREVLDPANKLVGSTTVAQVFFTTDPANRFQFLLLPSANAMEVTDIVQAMAQDYQARIGVTDYGRVRALIIDWLLRANRVTVRGSGGVYLVPRPKDQVVADQVQAELVSLATWISATPIASLFSIVEVSDQGATTVQVFQKAAIDELKAEMDLIDANLTKWAKNPNMNAGSMAYSAGTMLDRVDELTKKTEALIDALGEEIGIVQIGMAQIQKRAKAVQYAAQFEVDQYQATKAQAELAAKKAGVTKTPAKAAQKAPAAPKGLVRANEIAAMLPKDWDATAAPSVPLKPVLETIPVDAPTTDWSTITPVVQPIATVKAQGGTGKKSGLTGKGTKKL